ncbi:MAG: CPXCG motif-containing cysteine-rich protein [Arenicellales bacterium]|nr:CPXCG motif-containing cysteine-rich protein [Arenicellales bacterium]
MIEPRHIDCPYCGERFETVLDLSAGEQRYIEDCQVCCRPIEFELKLDAPDGAMTLILKRDDE